MLVTTTWALWGCMSELWGSTTTLHDDIRSWIFPFLVSFCIISLYILSIYTYFKIIWVGPGSPLDYEELRLDRSVIEDSSDSHLGNGSSEQSQQLLQSQKAPPVEILVSHAVENGVPWIRWCAKCKVWKPDRCHHCSSCNTCFLRMDHHCPWFSCCIGFRNHKFFVQFLTYMFFFCGTVFGVAFYLLYKFFVNQEYASNNYLSLTLVFLAVVSFAFLVCIGCFTAFLVYLVLRNLTTIEFQDLRWNYLGDRSAEYVYDSQGNKKSIANFYDLGSMKNWQAVMGTTWLQWLLPVKVTHDTLSGLNNGLNFEVDEEVFSLYCENLQLQDRLNQQLQQYRDHLRGQNH